MKNEKELICERCKGKEKIALKIKIDKDSFPDGGVVLFEYFNEDNELTARSECFPKDGWDGKGNLTFIGVCSDCVKCELQEGYKLFLP